MKTINYTEVVASAALYSERSQEVVSKVIAQTGRVRASNTALSPREPYSSSETLHKCKKVIAQRRAMNVLTCIYCIVREILLNVSKSKHSVLDGNLPRTLQILSLEMNHLHSYLKQSNPETSQ